MGYSRADRPKVGLSIPSTIPTKSLHSAPSMRAAGWFGAPPGGATLEDRGGGAKLSSGGCYYHVTIAVSRPAYLPPTTPCRCPPPHSSPCPPGLLLVAPHAARRRHTRGSKWRCDFQLGWVHAFEIISYGPTPAPPPPSIYCQPIIHHLHDPPSPLPYSIPPSPAT